MIWLKEAWNVLRGKDACPCWRSGYVIGRAVGMLTILVLWTASYAWDHLA